MATIAEHHAAPQIGRPARFPPAMLRTRIAVVRALLAQAEDLCGTIGDDAAGWHARYRAHLRSLNCLLAREHGAAITARGDFTIITMLGVRACATSGPASALRNWCTAADRKMRRM